MPDGGLDLEALSKSVEEVNQAFVEFQRKNDERLKEIETKGDADPLLEEQLDKINKSIDQHQEAIETANARLKRLASYGDADSSKETPEMLEKKAQDWLTLDAKSFSNAAAPSGDFGHTELQEYKRNFQNYLRKGEKVLDGDEFKALSVGGDPDGGYVVHPDMSGRVVTRIFETSPVRQYASVQVIGTDALEGLHDVDEAGFGWVGETGSRPETDTPQQDRWRIPVHEMYAAPRATQKILDDAAINMEAWLAGKVADKFARAEAAAFVNGSGADRPRGFLTYPDYTNPGEFQLGAIERFATGANGAFAAAPDSGDVLIDALYALKTQYRNNATWFMNRSTIGAVRKLKNSDGDYIWQPGISASQPATVLGYPQASFEDMPDIASGSLSIAVGDMAATYQIVDRVGIRVLRDPYSNKPYIEFYSTKRVGGDVVNFEALKIIEFTS